MMKSALSIQQATTSGDNASTTQSINLYNGVPLPFPRCHNKLMPTSKMRCYLHLMTKLNYFNGTITWGIFPSPY